MSQAPAQSKDNASSRQLQADFHLNQHVFRTIAYTATGFGLGIVGSLFFKHKAAMTAFFAGNGMGYGLAGFNNELRGFRSYRSFGQDQGQQGRGGDQGHRAAEDLAARAKNLANDAQNKGQEALQGAKNLANDAKDAVKNQAGKAEQGAKDLAGQAKDAVNNAKDAAKNQAGKAEQGAKDLANQAKDAYNNAKDGAKNQAGKAEQGAKDLANQAKDAVNNAKDAAKNQAGKVEQGAKDLAQKAKDAVNDASKSGDKGHGAAHGHTGSGQPNNIHNKPDEKVQHESDRNRQGIARVDVGESKDPSLAGHHDANPSLRHSGAGKTSNLNKPGLPVPTQGRHDEDGKKANPNIAESAANVGYRPPVNKSA